MYLRRAVLLIALAFSLALPLVAPARSAEAEACTGENCMPRQDLQECSGEDCQLPTQPAVECKGENCSQTPTAPLEECTGDGCTQTDN